MIDTIQELFETAFCAALLAGCVAAPVALMALLVDQLTGRWMAAGFRCWLWVVVAARLLMPFAPGSPVSLQHVWSVFESPQPEALAPAVETYVAEWDQAWSAPTVQAALQPLPRAATPAAATLDWEALLAGVLIAAWALGAGWVIARAAVASVRFRRRLSSLPPVDDPAILEPVRRACAEVGVAAPVVKQTPDLPAPALFGLLRPTLCLPAGETFTAFELRMVALHEAAHIRRRDGLLAWLLAAVRAAHWWNPIAWLAVSRVERYREQSCDNTVRRHTDADEQKQYAELLLRFASGRPVAAELGLMGLWFARPARNLSQRIGAFEASNRSGWLPWLAGVAAVAAVAIVGLTDASGSSAQPKPSPPKPPALSLGGIVATEQHGDRVSSFDPPPAPDPVEERTYDLTAALDKADRFPAGEDARRWLLRYTAVGGGLGFPITQPDKEDPNKVTISMTRRRHEFFASVLQDVQRFGHTFQVIVETRLLPSWSVESLPGVDWSEAVQFASSRPASQNQWADQPNAAPGEPSVSVESLSFEMAPFVVFRLSEAQVKQVVQNSAVRAGTPISHAPKITLFSGQTASVRDQTQSPYVTSVNFIRGEHATAAQPNITVIDQGVELDIKPRMINEDKLDLRCRLTLSSVDGVRHIKLPGQDITVQAPKVSRQTVTASSQMKQGETLVIASLAEKSFYYAITPRWYADPIELPDDDQAKASPE